MWALIYSATASRQWRGCTPVSLLNFAVDNTVFTGRLATKFFMSDSDTPPTRLAFKGIPRLGETSIAYWAHSCQLHPPLLARCRMPCASFSQAKRNQFATSMVYVGEDNLLATALTASFSRAR